jgi:hypothetical protein
MKNFEEVCKNIDWMAMEKARVSVKVLETQKPHLKYLSTFLEQLADAAVDVHGLNLNKVYPRATKGILTSKAKQNKN